ncbi:unnamed protein product [Effrenium voratum]|uniref:Uncharacterized protein n=1 Tax=Effrenium voratum TaxID=2562239 RepID=A0AA36N2F9_9DINO|nr:unnamed protein product [Effrenium voratum]CAJ1389748.1 unnamed protein product [Effrenium voratum]
MCTATGGNGRDRQGWPQSTTPRRSAWGATGTMIWLCSRREPSNTSGSLSEASSSQCSICRRFVTPKFGDGPIPSSSPSLQCFHSCFVSMDIYGTSCLAERCLGALLILRAGCDLPAVQSADVNR